MGDYAKRLNITEYEHFVKDVKTFFIHEGVGAKELADATGYSVKTVYDSLNSYERCSRFFIAAACEWMENYEKVNSDRSGDSDFKSTKS